MSSPSLRLRRLASSANARGLLVVTALLGLVAAQQRTPAQQFAELQAKLVEDAQRQLSSGDRTAVAWGAYTAAQFRLEACIPALRSRLQALPGNAEGSLTALTLLDALVQTDASVPGGELAPWLEGITFDSALVLASRDLRKNREHIWQAYVRYRQSSNYRASQCGDLLVALVEPRFAIDLLGERAKVFVHVVDAQPQGEDLDPLFDEAVGCSRLMVPKGFPPLHLNRIVGGEDVVGVGGGNKPESSRRRLVTHLGSYSWPGSLSWCDNQSEGRRHEQRAKWLARVAGMDLRNPCDLTRAKVIVWSDAETYRPAMLELRAGLLRDHRTLIDACVARNQISPEQAAAITLAIDFDIEDRRADQKIPLPKIE